MSKHAENLLKWKQRSGAFLLLWRPGAICSTKQQVLLRNPITWGISTLTPHWRYENMNHLLGTPSPLVESSKGQNRARGNFFAFSPFFETQISGFPGRQSSKVSAFQISKSPESQISRFPDIQVPDFQRQLAALVPLEEFSVPNLRASTFKKGSGEFILQQRGVRLGSESFSGGDGAGAPYGLIAW